MFGSRWHSHTALPPTSVRTLTPDKVCRIRDVFAVAIQFFARASNSSTGITIWVAWSIASNSSPLYFDIASASLMSFPWKRGFVLHFRDVGTQEQSNVPRKRPAASTWDAQPTAYRLVERSNTVLWRHELRARLVGRSLGKVDDRLFRRTIVPGRQMGRRRRSTASPAGGAADRMAQTVRTVQELRSNRK